MRNILLLLSVAVALSGCNKADETLQHYEVRGVIRGFSPDRQTIEIEHENIQGFMPSMTMPFLARNQKEIVDLAIGDAILFRMTVTQKDFWIDRVRKIDRSEVRIVEARATVTPSTNRAAHLREGDEMLVLTLTNQDRQHITLETFRGHPFVLTFVFTRCPIPNFCPRMSNNFAELQVAIKMANGPLAQTRLLSITLDPAFDTPEILKEYAAHLHGDPSLWTFATGDVGEIDALTEAFSVYRQNEGGTISHGLTTALIDNKGKIDKIWRGNSWTPAEVINEIRQMDNEP